MFYWFLPKNDLKKTIYMAPAGPPHKNLATALIVSLLINMLCVYNVYLLLMSEYITNYYYENFV